MTGRSRPSAIELASTFGAICLLVILVLLARAHFESQWSTPPSAPQLAGVTSSPSVAGGTHGDGYARAEFGRPWEDVDGNGCDTRNDELKTQVFGAVVIADDGCRVLGGTFVDPYNGRILEFTVGNPQPVQIDHVVSLHEAWHYGASQWDAAARLAFANDPSNLLPTTLNGTKGDKGPAALLDAAANPDSKWKPTVEGQCVYARAWSLSVAEWLLSPAVEDQAAASQMLRACP